MSLRSKLRDALRHPVGQNVLALGTVQAAVTVVPLITLPYLARVLDRTELGVVFFVQSFSFVVALLVEYGFNLSATRDVARRRDDPAALAETVGGVLGAKLALAGIATLAGLALLPFVPIFTGSPELLFYGLLLGVCQGFFPVWFFLGIERAQRVALAELVSRLLGLALIVVLVRDESDGGLVLAIYALAATISTGWLTIAMLRRVGSVRPSLTGSRKALRRGRTLFAGTGATALYTGANGFLLGLVVPASQVAIFGSAEKVVRAAARVLGQMAQAVYPRVSILISRGRVARANRLSGLAFLLFGGAACAAAALIAIFASPIVRVVFGPKFEDAVPLLRVLALVVPLNVMGVALITQWLLPRGLDRRVAAILASATVLNTALVIGIAELLELQAVAWAVVAVELFVMAGSAVAARGSDPAPDPSIRRPEVVLDDRT